MRILILTALLASVATPTLAAPRGHDRSEQRADRADRESNRAERRAERQADRAERRADRPERAAPRAADRPQRAAERPNRVERQAVRVRDQAPRVRPAPTREMRPAERAARINDRGSVRAPSSAIRPHAVSPRAIERRVGARGSVQDRTQARDARQAERRAIRDRQDYARSPAIAHGRAPRVSRVPVEGTQPPVRVASRDRDRDRHNWRDRDGRHWRGDWRNDRRYDWRSWRDRNRSVFRVGLYFDPFGWNYRRYNVGWRLWPSYYSSRYWINDPYMYRLPYAPPGYRWIRYYDDAVLVDTWTGQVEDVIYNFFW